MAYKSNLTSLLNFVDYPADKPFMNKLIIFSSLIIMSPMFAKPIIIKASSLKCNNTNQSVQHDIIVDIDEEKCLESKYPFGFGPDVYKNNVSFRIKNHDISCWPKEGSEVETVDKVSFKFPDDIKVLNSADDVNSVFTVKSVPSGYKKDKYSLEAHRDFTGHYGGDEGQQLKTSFKIVGKNIVPIPDEEYTSGNKPFSYFTNPDKPHAKERIYQYINKEDKKNIENIKPITQLNQVASLTCGDHEISRVDVSSSELSKERNSYPNQSQKINSSGIQR